MASRLHCLYFVHCSGAAAVAKAYPALMTYTRRMSYLLSMGEPAASVALFLPSSSMWLGDAASDTAFVSTERLLSEHQIDFVPPPLVLGL